MEITDSNKATLSVASDRSYEYYSTLVTGLKAAQLYYFKVS